MEPFAGMIAFARVVETGSFTAAATALGIAKSSISESVRALEDRLGVRLLDRTTRRVKPTEAGRTFYARCRVLLAEAEAARAEVRAMRDVPAGALRIAVPEAFAQRFLVPGLAGFLSRHPAVTVDVVEGPSPVNLVEEGFDLAIRVSEAPAAGLIVRRLATASVVIVGAPAYLARAGEPAAPADVARHATIGYSPLPWRDTWRLGREAVAVRPVLLTNSGEALRAAALAGIGLAAMPDWMVHDALAAGTLTRVLPAFPAPSAGIFAVYPGNRLIAPKVRVFVDHLARDLRARGLPP